MGVVRRQLWGSWVGIDDVRNTLANSRADGRYRSRLERSAILWVVIQDAGDPTTAIMLRPADVLVVIDDTPATGYKTAPSPDKVGLELHPIPRHVCVEQRCNALVGDCWKAFGSEGLWTKLHTRYNGCMDPSRQSENGHG
ncbi:hypothetical protein COCMIDRAFT_27942 [Bipolaris oryzae ATCC 44560]|uniref:Uncharacterized protein n=1 Tax=Bipolaris oryzae ATCC 44560 TaxID=930090 RepID=W6Z1M1_COCMI|nr:uncharacterized protein COCMIDRAFT_27942 [Bipolaris oryzae ATCC 44560]EUC43613.1 hypothetical protein COCMIDRAFT_27942 [Bipolaris oryzae ATCC 44560]